MDRIDHMRVLVAVADAGNLAGAARRLGHSAPAVTRAVDQLEARIGAQLLVRTTRRVRFTDVGERFLADCRRLLAELDEAEAVAGGSFREPQGLLSVTASSMFGRLHITPLVLAFLASHAKVQVRTLFVDRIVHLVDEGYDVAVRIAHLPDSGLTAVRVGTVRRVMVASPEYLAANGEPRSLADLAGHVGIGFTPMGAASAPWALFPDGERAAVEVQTPLVANTGEMAIAAAVAGRGLTRALSYQVADDVMAGRLRLVMVDHEPPPIPVQLVYPAGRKAAAKVRLFVDMAVAKLRDLPVLNDTWTVRAL
ncbi:MAG: LysR family transcriptional regulator [Hydrogenophaga sp.]|uniref:LysR family transcriptional regulator n=1 Tax=Hydrogenophaga sp. TaxID=1904254 RepID=UPI001D4431A0|nr:LysR family transcriptional regulator [Hydrogenophaga sp.]MBX3608539.1 LysR family transcriptional regulator [Hydrogenophaga sp.]